VDNVQHLGLGKSVRRVNPAEFNQLVPLSLDTQMTDELGKHARLGRLALCPQHEINAVLGQWLPLEQLLIRSGHVWMTHWREHVAVSLVGQLGLDAVGHLKQQQQQQQQKKAHSRFTQLNKWKNETNKQMNK